MSLNDYIQPTGMTGYRCLIGKIAAQLPEEARAELRANLANEAIGQTALAEAIVPWARDEHGVDVDKGTTVSSDMITRHRNGRCRHCAQAAE